MIKTDIVVIGAGPVGLFTVFEAGLLDLECHLIDNLDRPGGQCIELYPEKPIYDIPGVANQTAREHIEALMEQIKPFNPTFHLAQSVETLRFVKKNNKKYYIKTSAGTEFETPNVIVCSGAGSFEPKKLNIEDAEAFEGKGLEYAVRSKDQYTDKRVVVFGGGDSALDWTVELADIAKEITLVHRRTSYRAAPHTVAKAKAKENVKELTGNLESIHRKSNGWAAVEYVVVRDKDKQPHVVPCDEVLAFYGLITTPGPFKKWRLHLHFDRICVDTTKYETNRKGIFAVGDSNYYPGKLKLILCGFHEATLAVQECFRRARPGEKLKFQYTTTSTDLRKKLNATK